MTSRLDGEFNVRVRSWLGASVVRRWSLALLAASITLATFMVTLDFGYKQLRQTSHQRLIISEAVLRSAVNRYRYLPAVLALDDETRALLDNAPAAPLVAAFNAKLQTIARVSGAADVYVLDAKGLTLAASNWNQPLNYVGRSYAFRPYFVDAVKIGTSRYFGVGTTTSKPGLFIGDAVPAPDGRVMGVVVVKVDLEALQGEWRRADEQVLVSDDNGVVFLSSEPDWKYRPLQILDDSAAKWIRDARQYGDSTLQPLQAGGWPQPGEAIRLPAGDRTYRGLLERVTMPDLGWTLWYVSSTSPVVHQGLLMALAAFIACVAFAFGLSAASQRRQRLYAEQAMRGALENRVRERTRDLGAANQRLRDEIVERERATAALRATQNELIHAGRLAALGQISTAVNHEINQPLAALRVFLSSTLIFLDRNETTTVRRNLQRMSEMTQRIAEIISHLKAFARKTGPELREPVRLKQATHAALDLLQTRLQTEGVKVACDISDEAVVQAEQTRLEQVLLNLIVNALDAMHEASERQIHVTARREENGVWELAVADSGSGIAEEHMSSLFDPFFTTKPTGEGLGLGLSLSSMIIRDFGGTLSAANGKRGAVLSFVLPAAQG